MEWGIWHVSSLRIIATTTITKPNHPSITTITKSVLTLNHHMANFIQWQILPNYCEEKKTTPKQKLGFAQ